MVYDVFASHADIVFTAGHIVTPEQILGSRPDMIVVIGKALGARAIERYEREIPDLRIEHDETAVALPYEIFLDAAQQVVTEERLRVSHAAIGSVTKRTASGLYIAGG
ncbi:MAG TPA: hypothetical protein VLI54_04700 [Bacillota bacterium]|nr:hypothetical protein [Bacillota bacterium]